MNIESEDKQSVVILDPIRAELSAYPSLCVSIELKSREVSGTTQEVWIELEKLDRFLEALESLDTARKGEAMLESMSPEELRLRVFPLNSRGHIALEIAIGGRRWVGDNSRNYGCHTCFELDPTSLSSIGKEFRTLIQEAKKRTRRF